MEVRNRENLPEATDLPSLAPRKTHLLSLEPTWVSYLLDGRHGDSDTRGPSPRALPLLPRNRKEGLEVCGVFAA